jgi:ABC-2 type transport system permease protein
MLVFRKDWQEIRQSKQMLIPIIILPVVMVVVLPLVAIQVPVILISGQGAGNPSTSFSLPFEISSLTAGMTAKQAFVYSMSTVFFAPFTLLVPLIVSSIISADSFAGEKERKTVEAPPRNSPNGHGALVRESPRFFRPRCSSHLPFLYCVCDNYRLR